MATALETLQAKVQAMGSYQKKSLKYGDYLMAVPGGIRVEDMLEHLDDEDIVKFAFDGINTACRNATNRPDAKTLQAVQTAKQRAALESLEFDGTETPEEMKQRMFDAMFPSK